MNPALQLAAALALGMLAGFAATAPACVRRGQQYRRRIAFCQDIIAVERSIGDRWRAGRDDALAECRNLRVERDDAFARLDAEQGANAALTIEVANMTNTLRRVRDAVANA